MVLRGNKNMMLTIRPNEVRTGKKKVGMAATSMSTEKLRVTTGKQPFAKIYGELHPLSGGGGAIIPPGHGSVSPG